MINPLKCLNVVVDSKKKNANLDLNIEAFFFCNEIIYFLESNCWR